MRHTLSVLTVSALVLAGCASDPEPAPDPSSRGEPTPAATPSSEPAASADPTAPDASTTPTTTSPAAAPSPTPSDGVAAMSFTSCEAAAYTVGHPADWETNDPEGIADACRVFHPRPVDLPDQPQDRDLHWAASLYVDEVPFEDVTGAEPQGEVLQHRDTTVAGHAAQVTEVRSDGRGLVPEGETSYGYAIELDGRTLFAYTYTIGETDYERDKRVLDRMMEELTLTEG